MPFLFFYNPLTLNPYSHLLTRRTLKMTTGFTKEGKLVCDSSIEDKNKRGVREAYSYGVNAPSDGMIEFRLKVAEDEYVNIWMSCERARAFCNALDHMLLYHDVLGMRNTYSMNEQEWEKKRDAYLKNRQNPTVHDSKLHGIPNADTST